MNTKSTHIEKVKQQVLDTRELITSFTGISKDDYNQFYFDLGIKWSEKTVQDSDSVTYLTSQSMFWGWWAVEYSRYEEQFLEYFHFNGDCKRFLYIKVDGQRFEVYDQERIAVLYKTFMYQAMVLDNNNTSIIELSFHQALKK